MEIKMNTLSFGHKCPRLTSQETNKLLKNNLTIPLGKRLPAEIDENVVTTIKIPYTKFKFINKFLDKIAKIFD